MTRSGKEFPAKYPERRSTAEGLRNRSERRRRPPSRGRRAVPSPAMRLRAEEPAPRRDDPQATARARDRGSSAIRAYLRCPVRPQADAGAESPTGMSIHWFLQTGIRRVAKDRAEAPRRPPDLDQRPTTRSRQLRRREAASPQPRTGRRRLHLIFRQAHSRRRRTPRDAPPRRADGFLVSREGPPPEKHVSPIVLRARRLPGTRRRRERCATNSRRRPPCLRSRRRRWSREKEWRLAKASSP